MDAAPSILLTGGRIVTPEHVVTDGWLTVDRHLITGVGSGEPPPATNDRSVEHHELDGALVLPGFVDLHCHGGGGHTLTDGDPNEIGAATSFHRRHGTTTLLAGLVTTPLERLVSAIDRTAALIGRSRRVDGSPGTVAGLHLEGPFLAEAACGAQNPRHMIDPTPEAVAHLLDAGGGAVRLVTLAPERPGAFGAIRQLVDAGVVAAIGHTRADHDIARRAIDAGATSATHLFNAMSGLHHREPGTVGAVLTDDRITAELILDGHHVHPAAASVAHSAKGSRGLALVTDAIAAAGTTDGDLRLGGLDVVVADGAARLRDDGALAGSLLTMDRAVAAALELGWPVVDVAHMAATTPARVIGLDGTRGALEVGKHADLVVFDERSGVDRVLSAGRWVDTAR